MKMNNQNHLTIKKEIVKPKIMIMMMMIKKKKRIMKMKMTKKITNNELKRIIVSIQK